MKLLIRLTIWGCRYIHSTSDGKITQVAIPWKKALTARLSLDEDFQNRRLALQPFAGLVPPTTANRLMGYSDFTIRLDNYAEIDQMKLEAARALNASMIEMSSIYPELKDDRTRLEIIDYQLDTDGFGYGKILSEYGRAGVKYSLFAPVGYLLGEGTQALINTVNTVANSGVYAVGISGALGKTGPFGDDPVFPYVTDEFTLFLVLHVVTKYTTTSSLTTLKIFKSGLLQVDRISLSDCTVSGALST